MTSVVRVWSGLALAFAVALVPAAVGQSEALQVAIDVFEQRNYVAAQEALLKVDRDSLTDEELTRLDELLGVGPGGHQSQRAGAAGIERRGPGLRRRRVGSGGTPVPSRAEQRVRSVGGRKTTPRPSASGLRKSGSWPRRRVRRGAVEETVVVEITEEAPARETAPGEIAG